MTNQPSTKPRRRWPWYVSGAAILLIGIGSCVANTGAPTTYAPNPAPSTIFTAPTPAGPVTNIGDGTFEVGSGSSQVEPGTYRTTGPAPTGIAGCYWERDKDTSGNFDSIIANNLSKGPTTVTISTTDGAFKTSGCNTWTKVR